MVQAVKQFADARLGEVFLTHAERFDAAAMRVLGLVGEGLTAAGSNVAVVLRNQVVTAPGEYRLSQHWLSVQQCGEDGCGAPLRQQRPTPVLHGLKRQALPARRGAYRLLVRHSNTP